MLVIVIYISDFNYYIIENKVIIFGAIFSLALKFIYFNFDTFLISLASGLIVFTIMFVLKLIGDKIFRIESIGGGDVKLSFVFGCILGVRLAIVSLILGAFFAFPYALYYALTKIKKEIPFGPFLITALFIVFIFMEPIRNFLTTIFINY